MKAPRIKPLTSAQLRKKYKFVVPVLKSPVKAYKPERRPSSLVTNQLEHLQFAMQALPGWHRVGTKAADINTERGAAAFVAQVTQAMHRHGAPTVAPRTSRQSRQPAKPVRPRRPTKAVASRAKKRGRRA